jgi:GT2 family glycosyltransferase
MRVTVEIIILTRGREDIEPCLSSVRVASSCLKDNIRITLVADFAHEKLKELCRKFDVKFLVLKASPSVKRNFAARESEAEILIFCDDDVVVQADWLKYLLRHFNDPNVAVVGGPNLTPPNSSLREKCSGYIFASVLGGGSMSIRYKVIPKVMSVEGEELILCNMAVRNSVFKEIGGFPEKLYPCEENYLCRKIKERGYKLIYEPNAIVWHKRRPLFIPHLKQVFRYGFGRAKMIKMMPTTFKFTYLLPSLLTIGLLLGPILAIFNSIMCVVYLLAVASYFGAVLISSANIALRNRNFKAFMILIPGFILHHLSYGIGFLIGLIRGDKR